VIGDLPVDKDGKPTLPKSRYEPTEPVRLMTDRVKKDYFIGYTINHKPYAEFNDRDLVTVIGDNQKKFNSYIPPESSDPEESWRWRGVRPITRNKIISLAAHTTASIIFPNVFAQNEADEEDQQAGEIMRDLVKWNIKNSKYEISFLFGVIAALVNPVSYFNIDFIERLQTIKERNENGSITTRDVLDDVLSGIQLYSVPADEMMIGNIYEFELQRQRFLIRRRFIEYDEAMAIHGEHANFEFVQPGIQTIYDNATDTFYDQVDEEMPTMVEEVVYFNRREDTEIPFVNGIYMGDTDVNDNPMRHRDNRGKPYYPYVKFGYEPIDEKKFYFYKSAVDKIAPDQDLIDTMWRMVMDGTFLAVMPPMGISGSAERAPTSIIMPGAVSNLPEGTEFHNLAPKSDLNAGWRALQGIEESIIEGSQAPSRQGIAEKGQKTAFEISKIEENARVQLGIFGKQLKDMVESVGSLMINLIIHFQTIGEAEELTGGETQMKFRTFLLEDEVDEGKNVTKKIKFSEELIGSVYSEEEKEQRERALIDEEGGFDSNTRIYKVNPELFSKLKFKVVVEADSLLPRNEAFEKALKLEAYDRMIQNPFVDQEAVTRDFLVKPLAKSEAEKYMKKQVPGLLPQEAGQGGQGMGLAKKAVNSEALASIL